MSERMTAAQVAAHNAKFDVNGKRREILAKVEGAVHDYEDESELHQAIKEECNRRGWICFTGSMAHRAMRTVGEPDMHVLADRGRVFFVELKSKTGKLSPEQVGIKAWASTLGHEIHVVRSPEQFLEIVK